MTTENKGYSLAVTNRGSKTTAEKVYLKPMALYVPDIAVAAVAELVEKLADKNKATNAKKLAKPISLHQAYSKIDPTPRYVSVGGGM